MAAAAAAAAAAEGSVIVHDGLRHIVPYWFTYQTFAKQRWFGRPLLDVLATEFAVKSVDTHRRDLETGRVLVNGERAPPDYCIRSNDSIRTRTHRHEPPVPWPGRDGLCILERRDDGFLVVNKPGGMPVHPTGRYNFNTVEQIVRAQLNDDRPVWVCHRLDKATSGVCVLATNAGAAKRWASLMRDGKVRKTYYARVLGEFPASDVVVDRAIKAVDVRYGQYAVCDGKDQSKNARSAKTLFRRVSYNGHTSLVEARPVTGRTHQIRLHLQALGHPIADDPSYGGQLCAHNSSKRAAAYTEDDLRTLRVRERFCNEKDACRECASLSYFGGDNDAVHVDSIWLFAASYQGPNWTFSAPLPSWCDDTFDSRAYMVPEHDFVRIADRKK